MRQLCSLGAPKTQARSWIFLDVTVYSNRFRNRLVQTLGLADFVTRQSF